MIILSILLVFFLMRRNNYDDRLFKYIYPYCLKVPTNSLGDFGCICHPPAGYLPSPLMSMAGFSTLPSPHSGRPVQHTGTAPRERGSIGQFASH